MKRSMKGFTLIELLIVVVIIGILAAIAIPKFAATKQRAYVAAVKTDLKNLATAEEGYASADLSVLVVGNMVMATNRSPLLFLEACIRYARSGSTPKYCPDSRA